MIIERTVLEFKGDMPYFASDISVATDGCS